MGCGVGDPPIAKTYLKKKKKKKKKLAQIVFFGISKIIIYNFVKFMAPKKGMATIFFSPSIFWLFLDPRSGMGKNQDPGSCNTARYPNDFPI
jgi:hypothetical protein